MLSGVEAFVIAIGPYVMLSGVEARMAILSNETYLPYIMNNYCVYILKCSDGSYYTGITNDVERRFDEHSHESVPTSYTFTRRPLEMVFTEYFQDVNDAISFEKQVKGWSRKKKEAIIKGNWENLPELAKCQNKSTHLLFDSAQSDKGLKSST